MRSVRAVGGPEGGERPVELIPQDLGPNVLIGYGHAIEGAGGELPEDVVDLVLLEDGPDVAAAPEEGQLLVEGRDQLPPPAPAAELGGPEVDEVVAQTGCNWLPGRFQPEVVVSEPGGMVDLPRAHHALLLAVLRAEPVAPVQAEEGTQPAGVRALGMVPPHAMVEGKIIGDPRVLGPLRLDTRGVDDLALVPL